MQKKSKTHIVGQREMRKQKRDVLEEEMRNIDKCGMEDFGTSDRQPTAVEGRWLRPQAAKHGGDNMSKYFYVVYGNSAMSAQLLGGVAIRSRNGAPSRKGCLSND